VEVLSFMGFIIIANGQLSLGTCNFVVRQITNSDQLTKATLNNDLKSATINKCSRQVTFAERKKNSVTEELNSETKLHFFPLWRNSPSRV